MAKETAEQKLLRLIEQSGGGADSSAAPGDPMMDAQQTLSAVQSVTGAIVLPNFFQRMQFSIKAFSVPSFRGGLGIREINKFLAAAAVFVIVIFGLNMQSGLKAARQTAEFQQPKPVLFSKDNLLPFSADLERYIQAVAPRNIFNPFEKQEIAAPVAVVSPAMAAAQRIMDRTRALRLVGLSWLESADTASAMVENVESGITYFLRSGEKFNGMTVESIYADSIVLEFEGERMELRL